MSAQLLLKEIHVNVMQEFPLGNCKVRSYLWRMELVGILPSKRTHDTETDNSKYIICQDEAQTEKKVKRKPSNVIIYTATEDGNRKIHTNIKTWIKYNDTKYFDFIERYDLELNIGMSVWYKRFDQGFTNVKHLHTCTCRLEEFLIFYSDVSSSYDMIDTTSTCI